MRKLIFAVIIAVFPVAVQAEELKFEANWSGMTVGVLTVDMAEDKASYTANAAIKVGGLMRTFTNYWSEASVSGHLAKGQYVPETYATKWQPKKLKELQNISVAYKNGVAVETASPAENRKKRPEVEAKDKNNTLDPISAGFAARAKVREIMAANPSFPQSFKLGVFDGRRVFDMTFTITGFESRNIGGKDLKLLHVRMFRTAIAGFNKKELLMMKTDEPIFEIYLNDSYTPVWAYGKAGIGTVTITLK